MAVRFDANADGLTNTAGMGGPAYSMALWGCRRVDRNTDSTVVSMRESAAGGVLQCGLSTGADGDILRIASSAGSANLFTMVDGEPFFAGFVYVGGTSLTGYYRTRGQAVVQQVAGSTTNFISTTICVGNRFAGDGERFDGSLWNVKFWGRALNFDQMQQASECADMVFNADAIFHWRLRHKTDTHDAVGGRNHATVGGTLETDAVDILPADRMHGLWVPRRALWFPPAAAAGFKAAWARGSNQVHGTGAMVR